MIRAVTEFFVDDAALAWLESLGYTVPRLGSENCSPSEKITASHSGGARAATGAKNATVQIVAICKKCTVLLRDNYKGLFGGSESFGVRWGLRRRFYLNTKPW
jgi:hypothetical protein